MQRNSTAGRLLAIAALLAFTGGGLYILLSDGPLWTMTHVLTVLTVFGTIASGHLCKEAFSVKHFGSVFGFAMLFTIGTGLVVYNSVGRQAATSAQVANKAISVNEMRSIIRDQLEDERTGLKEAMSKIAWEMAGRPDSHGNRTTKPICGKGCVGWKDKASGHRAEIDRLEQKLADLGPAQIVNAKAKKTADVLAIFGFDRAKAVAAITMLEPFLSTLFFEFGSIVAAGFAFRVKRFPVANDNRPVSTVSTVSGNGFRPPRGGKPRLVEEHRLITELKRGGPADSQDELAQRLGVSKGEVSKTVTELGNSLEITRHGRCNRIALAG